MYACLGRGQPQQQKKKKKGRDLVVLAVVQLHDLATDHRLQSAVGVRQGGQGVLGTGASSDNSTGTSRQHFLFLEKKNALQSDTCKAC